MYIKIKICGCFIKNRYNLSMDSRGKNLVHHVNHAVFLLFLNSPNGPDLFLQPRKCCKCFWQLNALHAMPSSLSGSSHLVFQPKYGESTNRNTPKDYSLHHQIKIVTRIQTYPYHSYHCQSWTQLTLLCKNIYFLRFQSWTRTKIAMLTVVKTRSHLSKLDPFVVGLNWIGWNLQTWDISSLYSGMSHINNEAPSRENEMFTIKNRGSAKGIGDFLIMVIVAMNKVTYQITLM